MFQLNTWSKLVNNLSTSLLSNFKIAIFDTQPTGQSFCHFRFTDLLAEWSHGRNLLYMTLVLMEVINMNAYVHSRDWKVLAQHFQIHISQIAVKATVKSGAVYSTAVASHLASQLPQSKRKYSPLWKKNVRCVLAHLITTSKSFKGFLFGQNEIRSTSWSWFCMVWVRADNSQVLPDAILPFTHSLMRLQPSFTPSSLLVLSHPGICTHSILYSG